MRPDLDKPDFFDNAPNHATEFWGIYTSHPINSAFSVDAYYLGLDRQSATFNRGAGREVRQNLGVRLWNPLNTTVRGWDFDDEAVWQFGSFANGGIDAWTLASDTGYLRSCAKFNHLRKLSRIERSSDGSAPHSTLIMALPGNSM